MKKKLLIITGGSKGIGRATAERFSAEGFDVINLSRSTLDLDGASNLSVDLSDIDWPAKHGTDLTGLIESSREIVLIHNAALHYSDSTETVNDVEMQQSLQVNLVAPTQLNQLVLPYMSEGSSILYLGSTLSEKAIPGACSYVTSKHGVVGLMRSTCQDLAGRGVHTACICPGFTDTEMLRGHIGEDQDVINSITSNVAFGRLIETEEIASTLYFCANNAVINGTVMHANLGQIER